jgi:hypothetical protein
MKDIFLVLSGVLTIACVLPYLRDITRRKTKPRIVSWFNWTLLTGIATAAAIADQQWPSAVLTGAATITTLLVVILGLRYGDNKIEPFDIACQIGAIVGLILWLIFDDPLIAIIITAAVDFIAALPTFRHSWLKPFEETKVTFIIAAVASSFSLLAINEATVSGLIYPVYILMANLTIASLLQFSPNQKPLKS